MNGYEKMVYLKQFNKEVRDIIEVIVYEMVEGEQTFAEASKGYTVTEEIRTACEYIATSMTY